MSLFLDIGQGAGVSGATGVRPFLPVLLTGALAHEDKGVDFDGTDYSFLEKPVFLLIVLLLAVVAYALSRRAQTSRNPNDKDAATVADRVVAMLGIALGALMFGGSLAAGDETAWWGLIAGALCAALGYLAVAALFARARSRVAAQRDAGGAAALIDVYAEGVALVLAALSLFVEPVGYLALVLFLVLLVRSRGEGAQKYGGLRILR